MPAHADGIRAESAGPTHKFTTTAQGFLPWVGRRAQLQAVHNRPIHGDLL
jgi:hypothetical protein